VNTSPLEDMILFSFDAGCSSPSKVVRSGQIKLLISWKWDPAVGSIDCRCIVYDNSASVRQVFGSREILVLCLDVDVFVEIWVEGLTGR
jgi:hypothetical protein